MPSIVLVYIIKLLFGDRAVVINGYVNNYDNALIVMYKHSNKKLLSDDGGKTWKWVSGG